MLDHPDEFYMNVYRAWRRRNAPNVDVRIVIAVAISLVSLVQYYNGAVKWVSNREGRYVQTSYWTQVKSLSLMFKFVYV